MSYDGCTMPVQPADAREQILNGTQRASKTFAFASHCTRRPSRFWFQTIPEGTVLFVVFHTQACRWNRCVGCNLSSESSLAPVHYRDIIAQVDNVFSSPEVQTRAQEICKIIVSNNGSILDQVTFPSTALFYLLAKINLDLPAMTTLCLESRPEYVEFDEIAYIARALRERSAPAHLELGVGFEVFDDQIRNQVFDKGLTRTTFEQLVGMMAPYRYRLKCYFMQKPVPAMSDSQAIIDIQHAIDYLDGLVARFGTPINLHLNPTYAARGTRLAEAFHRGEFTPPRLSHVIEAVSHGRGKRVSIYVGLNDEGLAVPGGSFLRDGDEALVTKIETFNSTQDYDVLVPRA